MNPSAVGLPQTVDVEMTTWPRTSKRVVCAGSKFVLFARPFRYGGDDDWAI